MSKLKKALEKAKVERGDQKLVSSQSKLKSAKIAPPKQIADYRRELDISYSETKVKKIDSHILKRGKILSF